MEKESLASLKIIDETSILIETKKGTWQKRMADLPDTSRLDAYRSRVEKLKTASRSLRFVSFCRRGDFWKLRHR